MSDLLKLPPPESKPAPISAFTVHGIWTPAVVLMRRISFKAKALIISAIFLIPILLSMQFLISTQMGSIRFAEKEVEGVRYARALLPAMHEMVNLRHLYLTGQDPASARTNFEQHLKSLSAAQSQLGELLRTRSAYDAFNQQAQATLKLDGSVGAEKLTEAYASLAQASVDLLGTALDESNLTLDPDIDTYYLMDGALVKLPALIDSSGRIRDLLLYHAKHGEFPASLQRELLKDEVWSDDGEAGLALSLRKVLSEHPDLQSKLNQDAPKRALHTSHEFIQADAATLAEKSAELDQLGDTAVEGFIRLQTTMVDELERLLQARVTGLQTTLYLAIGIVTFCVLLAGYMFYAFYLVTRGGLRLISQHLQEMAEGDLRRAPSQPWGKDEPAAVIVDLRRTYEALHLLIRRVRHAARELAAASSEISSGSLELSARTEAAAASLEEQASAMEEIGSQVGDTAQRTQSAAGTAQQNAAVAQRGGEVIREVVTNMQEVQASSSKIADIIGVIDGIAFQTNILALNAAVEAARAGESGRGFAVVATEVRNLAGRSAEAAREIKTLISESVARTAAGAKVVESAGAAMNDIVHNAQEINQFLDEISAATKEQASGVEQVTQAIQVLDQSTQQNAALVEETASAATALKKQADLLTEQIANFRVA